MQKYLLDENLSRKLLDKLNPVYQNITHVAVEGLQQKNDTDIWQFAKSGHYIIITKDNDFTDMSHLFGCPPKVVKLNCGNRTSDYIGGILSTGYELIKNFAESTNCYMEIL